MRISLKLSQNQIINGNVNTNFEKVISLTDFNANSTKTFGQIVGYFAHTFFASTMRARLGGNKSFNFNNLFDFAMIIEDKVVFDTMVLGTSERFKIRMSTKKDGQKRFAQLLALSILSCFEKDGNKFVDLLCDDIVCDTEMIENDLREYMDLPFAVIVETFA